MGGGPGGPTRGMQAGGQQGQQGPPPPEKLAEPAKPKLTVDQMEKRITSTLEEYVEIQELQEVQETLKELPTKECYPFVIYKAVDISCNTPKHKTCLVKLMGELFEKKILTDKQLQTGMSQFFEMLEDVAIDIPSAPKLLCGFLIHGTKDTYWDWEYIRSGADKYVTDKSKFMGTLLNALIDELGVDNAPKAWRESGVSIAQFGVADEAKFVQEHNLGKLFPTEEIGKLVQKLIDDNASEDDMIAAIEKAAGELECTVDRDMSRTLVKCVLQKVVTELGGAEELQKSDGEKLIEPKEKAALEQRKKLLKKWLDKECDQAFVLFEVQKCAQDMSYPKGFLSRMLATLYDLEVVEEKGVQDWLSPPDNRHLFLKQAKDSFAVKDNVEAKKQAQKFIDWLAEAEDQ